MTSIFDTLIAFDDSLFIAINSAHTPFFDIFFQIFTNFGTAFVVAPILLLIIYRTIPQKQRSRMLLFGAVSLSVSGIVTQGIKNIVHRPRPLSYFVPESQNASANHSNRPVHTVHVLGPRLKRRSFPSGHTNTAFAAATFLVVLYGGWYWTSYLIALLVAYSRIYMGVHFFSDTLGGALLAVATVLIFYQLFGIRKYLLTCGVKHDT